MSQNQKLGDKKFKAGKQNVTTGIFQWSKDYSSGATNFSEALKLFKLAGNFKKALEALKELIICNDKLLDNWAVARNYQEMLDIYITQFPETSLETLKETAKTGFHYFRMAEAVDKGIAMLSRIANMLLKKGDMKQGVQILKTAYQSSLQDEKSFKKKDLLAQIVQAYMDAQIYSEVEKIYKDLIRREPNGDNTQFGLIVLVAILIQHEPKRAEKQMYELSNLIPNFLVSDECQAIDELIKAYRKGESQKFMKWTTKPAITCIYPVIFIKKLRQVQVPSAPLLAEEIGEEQQENMAKLLF